MHREAQTKPQKKEKTSEFKNISCKYCNGKNIVKNGQRRTKVNKRQRFLCRHCKKTFTIDNGFFRMRNSPELITTCLDLYMNGLSLRKVRNHFNQFHKINISHQTILNWIYKYSLVLKKFTDSLEPDLSKTYHADEIFIKCKGNQHYFWDIIDAGTRFLVSTHYSTKRDSKSAKMLFLKAKHKPLTLFTDRLQGYRKAYRKVWGSKTRKQDSLTYIRLKADKDKRNNIIERIQRTIRERIKVIRGFKNKRSAELMLNLFIIYYNFIRDHQGIKMTPAEKAGIDLELKKNKWLDLIKRSRNL